MAQFLDFAHFSDESLLTDGEACCLGKRISNTITTVYTHDLPRLSPEGIMVIYVGNTP